MPACAQYLFTMPSLLSKPGGLCVCMCLCVNKQTLRGSLFTEIQQGPTKLTFFIASRIMRPSTLLVNKVGSYVAVHTHIVSL